MSTIVKELIAGISEGLSIKKIVCGPKASFAITRHGGVACNLTHGFMDEPAAEAKDFCERLVGSNAQAAAKILFEMTHPIARASAIAILNSSQQISAHAKCNGFDILEKIALQKRVAMVGHFKMADKLQNIAGHLDVLELEPQGGDLPAREAANVIPKADIVIITGTTFVNGTIDEILSCTNKGQTVMLLGPSTPVTKRLFSHGVSIICGVSIDGDEAGAEKLIRDGVSFRDINSWHYATICRDEKLLQSLGIFC